MKFMTMGKKFAPKIFKNVYAQSKMNTVTRETGTSLDGGEAVKLDHHVRAVYSKEIEFQAQPIMRWAQFARVKTELGVQPGLTINMMTYNNLAKGGPLTEGVRMQTTTLSSTMKSITVGERGNAVSVSELALKSSFTDIMADAAVLLGRDMALVLDLELRDTFFSGITNTVFGRLNSEAEKIKSRSAITNKNPMSVATIKDAVEILATANCPKFQGNYYICLVHPHQSRMLRDDPAWIEASKYGSPENLFTGEIGRIDDTRFIETTLMPNGACAPTDNAYDADLAPGAVGAPADTPVYQAAIFGEDCYGYAVALPVELRDNGVTDFGREHGLAWYAIWGCGILNEDRGVIIETC